MCQIYLRWDVNSFILWKKYAIFFFFLDETLGKAAEVKDYFVILRNLKVCLIQDEMGWRRQTK